MTHIEAKQVYEWVKTGHWSKRQFMEWFTSTEESSSDVVTSATQESVAKPICSDERPCLPCYLDQGECAATQEPVGILNSLHCNCGATWTFKNGAVEYKSGKLKYEWVGLMDEEIKQIYDEWRNKVCSDAWGYERAIEAKLKEKNQ